MTRAKQAGVRLRRIILVAGIIYVLLAMVWLVLPLFGNVDDAGTWGLFGTPFTPGALFNQDEAGYAINVILIIGPLFIAQWLFLRPRGHWRIRLTREGKPLRTAVFTAAFMAMLLTVGFIALLLELPDWWASTMGGPDSQSDGEGIIGVWLAMLLIWGVWAGLFFVYWRQGDRYTQLGRMVRGLVAGSLIEVFVAVPVHVWATRQRECYCCRGTYTTLVFAGAVLFWAFGPGIVLLYKREEYRRRKLLEQGNARTYDGLECEHCGYDLRGTQRAGGSRCPECGTMIEESK